MRARSPRFQEIGAQRGCGCEVFHDQARPVIPLALRQESRYIVLSKRKGRMIVDTRMALPQGTLDLLILKALALEPLHGWAVSERLQQMTADALQVGQGSLYPALHRLERAGRVKARWRITANNRRAKYYELTSSGHRQLESASESWRKLAAVIGAVLDLG